MTHQTKALAIITATAIVVSMFWLWLGMRTAPNIGAYYDIKWNSASAYVCVTHEPSDAHPELCWNWKKFNFGIKIICHGNKQI